MVTCTDCGQKFKDYIEYTKHKCPKGEVPPQDKALGQFLESCNHKDEMDGNK